MDFALPFFPFLQRLVHGLIVFGFLCLGLLSVLRADEPPSLAFNGGTATITNLPSGQWSYHRVEVPATPGIMGWDVRIRDVTGGSPILMVRRDLAPEIITNSHQSFWDLPQYETSWPSGHQLHGQVDWTSAPFDPNGNHVAYRRLVLGMKAPLEPGTYYLGVYNSGSIASTSSYTVESRSIGPGQVLDITPVAFAGGTVAINSLAPREAAYLKVTIPPNTRSWEFTLNPPKEIC